MPRLTPAEWAALVNPFGNGLIHMALFLEALVSTANPTLFEAISSFLLLYGTHAARPTATTVPLNAIYFETDTGDGFQNQAGTWVQVSSTSGGSGAPTDATYIVTAPHTGLSAEQAIPGMAGDPDTLPASPGGSDDEFDTTDTSPPITGWTTLGSPTAMDTNSTRKSHLYITKAATSSVALAGVYKAWTPSAGAVVTAKLSAANMLQANYQRIGGLFCGEGTPGKIEAIHPLFDSTNSPTTYPQKFGVVSYTNPTTFSANIGTPLMSPAIRPPIWLRLIYNSSTSLTWQASFDGTIWYTIAAGHNPGFTVGSVGLCVDPENATFDAASAYDYIRFS